MTQLPNPFLNSDALAPVASGSAVVSKPPPVADATAAPIADPDGGYMGHRLSPALGTSVYPAAASSRTSVLDAQTGAAAEPISSLGVVADRGTAQRLEIEPRNAEYFSGPTASGAVWHGENGCSDPAPPCDLTRPSQFNNDSPSNERRPSEASAPAPTKNPDADALDLTDCISEIFFYARRLMKQPPRFVLDEARFLADTEETPLFVRDGEHLRRWTA